MDVETAGQAVTILARAVARATGLVSSEDLTAAVRPGETCLVSVMAVGSFVTVTRSPAPVMRGTAPGGRSTLWMIPRVM